MLIAQMGKGSHITPDSEHHIPAPAAIPSGRPALGNIFFPPESYTAVPARSGGHFDYCLVGKFLHEKKNSKKMGSGEWGVGLLFVKYSTPHS
jgi:hypothetical protein